MPMAAEDTTLCLKGDQDRVRLPVTVLRDEARRLIKLVAETSVPGRFRLTPAQSNEARDRLVDILACLESICDEMASLMESVTVENASPDQRTS